jgi:HK97 family phage portal protein
MFDWLRRLVVGEQKGAPHWAAWQPLSPAHWPSRDGGAFAREGYGRNAIAYRCVRFIAESAASAPLRVTPHDHPLAAVLDQPNSEQTGVELLEAFFGHLQVSGNAYLERVSLEEEGAPLEIFALRPDHMSIIPGARGGPIGFEHRVGAHVRRFERDPLTGASAVLHMKLFHPLDDWYGQSPMAAAAFAIDIHNAGGAWNKALIDNAARPSGAIVFSGAPGERLTEEQFSRLKAEFEAVHTGALNAGRPMLLEGGLEWKPMSYSPAEMDFLQARYAAARDIALAFGVPPMLLGIPGDNTYSNYKEANLAFWRQTALPLAVKTARALQHWLGAAWPNQPRARVDVDVDAIPALAAEREMLWARVAGADFLSVEEKRRLVGVQVGEGAQ